MARHNDILNRFKVMLPEFNFTNKEHKDVVTTHHSLPLVVWFSGISPAVSVMMCFQLMKIMVKVSDISNEARPMAVAEPWLDCLLQEFFNQVRCTFCRTTHNQVMLQCASKNVRQKERISL